MNTITISSSSDGLTRISPPDLRLTCESTSSTYENWGIHSNHSKGYRDTRVTSSSFLSTVNVWVLETTNLSLLCPQVWAPSCCLFGALLEVVQSYFQRNFLCCPPQYYYLYYADEKGKALEERSACFIPGISKWLGVIALLQQDRLWASGMLSWVCWWS